MREVLLLILKIFFAATKAICRYVVPKSKKSVKGEVVLITGSAEGIGRELAFIYASEGATVVCVDINEELNEQTLGLISDAGYGKAYTYKCDVSDYQQVSMVCQRIEKEVGNVTILINNVGVLITNHFCELTTEEIEKMVKVNLMSYFWTVKAILPSMLKNNYGHIVSIASVATIVSIPYLIPYSASKYAIQGFMEGLQNELLLNKNCKIKTTLIHPCITNTSLMRNANMIYSSMVPVFKPKDVAEGIVNAQRRDIVEAIIPSSYYLPFRGLARLFPAQAVLLVFNYLQTALAPR